MPNEDKQLDTIDFSNPKKVRDNYFNDRYSQEAYKELNFLEKRALSQLLKSDSRTYKPVLTGAFNKANQLMDRALPNFIARDKTTKKILGAGATIWVLDSWNPVSPVGEIGLTACFTTALVRGTFIHVKNKLFSNNDRTPK